MVTFEKQQQEGQESGTDLGHTCFQLQTPMVVLPRATASTIVAELCGWFLCALGLGGAVGSRWQILGVQESLFAGIPIQGQALCFDSLSTNIKICKLLRTELYKEEGKNSRRPCYPIFGADLRHTPTGLEPQGSSFLLAWLLVFHCQAWPPVPVTELPQSIPISFVWSSDRCFLLYTGRQVTPQSCGMARREKQSN